MARKNVLHDVVLLNISSTGATESGGLVQRALRAGGKFDDGFLGDGLAGVAAQFSGEYAFAHDEHAVGHADDLGQFARNHDDAHAGFGEVVDDAVDLRLRADVHAAG